MLLDSEQPEPLGEGPFHLAYVNGRVDAVAQVHEDVGPQYGEAPREGVHLHLGAGRAVGVVAVG